MELFALENEALTYGVSLHAHTMLAVGIAYHPREDGCTNEEHANAFVIFLGWFALQILWQ